MLRSRLTAIQSVVSSRGWHAEAGVGAALSSAGLLVGCGVDVGEISKSDLDALNQYFLEL